LLPARFAIRLVICARSLFVVRHNDIARIDGDDVVVVGKLAGFSAKAEICDGRDFDVGDGKAEIPFSLVFSTLRANLEDLVVNVGDF
jgi:hypothetical protein